ncbi:DUF2959 domain-containing protein [Glaciecola sp. MH2013]|nr:DUF2959 domain-containing protein [Glaciecola sp. MH2013]MBF7073846.1 DUF2959 domain-containing protein [Glaciecola sp. MH2013]
MRFFAILMMVSLLASCQSVVDNAYYGMWEKLGVEKRDILVDRVEDAQRSQKDAQEQFSSALEEFSALINFDGGELEAVYNELSDKYDASQSSAEDLTKRIDDVENVAQALFEEWEQEIELISNAKLKRNSKNKLADTKRKYASLLRSMRKVEASMQPVLIALRDNVLALKHNLNANAIGALQGEFNDIKQDVASLITEMNAAIKQSDEFIKEING